MLTAYFDDSGTHDDSEVVVYGGLMGSEDQWLRFDTAWQAKLDNPLPGKPRLKRFHMSHCMAHRGEFSRYSATEAETLAADFLEIIIESGLWLMPLQSRVLIGPGDPSSEPEPWPHRSLLRFVSSGSTPSGEN